jgi:hypothetical protein
MAAGQKAKPPLFCITNLAKTSQTTSQLEFAGL